MALTFHLHNRPLRSSRAVDGEYLVRNVVSHLQEGRVPIGGARLSVQVLQRDAKYEGMVGNRHVVLVPILRERTLNNEKKRSIKNKKKQFAVAYLM